jgi:DNA-binding response OmpR family regulator
LALDTDILIVEDDEGIGLALSDLLGDNGISCVLAGDGDEALLYLEVCDELPKGIVLDLMMPRMDGWEFLAEHRQSKRHRDIPVIVVTATMGAKTRRAELSDGAVHLIVPKPFSSRIIVGAVRALLGGGGAEGYRR